MLKRVFCAIDDQEHSGRAADTAIEIARTMSSALIFFMANPAVTLGQRPQALLTMLHCSTDCLSPSGQARGQAMWRCREEPGP